MTRRALALLLALAAPAVAQPAAPQRAVPRYDLTVRLDPDAHRLEGTGTIVIPASPDARPTIGLALTRTMRDLTVEVVAPAVSAGVPTIEAGTGLGANTLSTLRPKVPFPAGQPVELRVSWRGGEEGVAFHLGPEGSFASGINVAWYPLARGGLSTGTLTVIAPRGLSVHASGVQRGSARERSRGLFRYELETPSFFAFAAARYTVVRRDGPVPISVYLLKPRPDVESFIEGCRRSIEVLSQEFGSYPSGEFAIVETPKGPSDAAGFAGASVTSFVMVTPWYLDQPFNLAFFGHEIAHQWWGNLIRRSGPRGNWMLDEAMAQYGSLRVVETLDGREGAETYRRTGYPGYIPDQSGLGYLKVLAAGKDAPLADLPEDVSRALPDGKGFQIWDLLSRTIGRETFSRILREFTQTHAFQVITWDQLLTAIEAGAGRSLRWFYEQWFDRPGVPAWQLAWSQDGTRLVGTIRQEAPFFRATVPMVVAGDGESRTIPIDVDGGVTEFSLPINFRVASIVLDPEFGILHWTPEYRAAVAAK